MAHIVATEGPGRGSPFASALDNMWLGGSMRFHHIPVTGRRRNRLPLVPETKAHGNVWVVKLARDILPVAVPRDHTDTMLECTVSNGIA